MDNKSSLKEAWSGHVNSLNFGTHNLISKTTEDFPKKRKKSSANYNVLRALGRHKFAMITDRPKLVTKITFNGMYSFHFNVRINSKPFL